MKRLRVEQDRSLIGSPDTWMVVEANDTRGWLSSSVLFRGTYCECLKKAEELANARSRKLRKGN
jgi:hypothetical protein